MDSIGGQYNALWDNVAIADEFEERDGKLIVSFRDFIRNDIHFICERAANTPKKRLVLDFADVRFMSSAAIGRLVMVFPHAERLGVDVRRCNDSFAVREVLKITRLHKVIILDDDCK